MQSSSNWAPMTPCAESIPQETEKALDRILSALRERRLPVLLAGMRAPRNLGADYGRQFDAIFPRLAEKYGVLFYPFFLDGVAAEPALNQPDGLHPNSQRSGHDRLANPADHVKTCSSRRPPK